MRERPILIAYRRFERLQELQFGRDRVDGAHEEQGYWLAGYAYHGQVGDAFLRYCFDPQGHPEMPYHRHPPRAVKGGSAGDVSAPRRRLRRSTPLWPNRKGSDGCR